MMTPLAAFVPDVLAWWQIILILVVAGGGVGFLIWRKKQDQ